MFSLDTNILVYAANRDCLEHPRALALVEKALSEPERWLVAEQVLLEFYKALRHPKILSRPMSPAEAIGQVRFLRKNSGMQIVTSDLSFWDEIEEHLESPGLGYQRTFDVVLGVTLRMSGVKTFYTRNTRDVAGIGFERVINPIDT